MVSIVLVIKDLDDWRNYSLLRNNGQTDFKELEITEKGIKIEQLRDWLRTSYLGRGKKEQTFYILKGADNLSVECQNILLKPLEEPKRGVGFILVARSIYRLLPTILSRCQVVEYKTKTTKREPKILNDIWQGVINSWSKDLGEVLGWVDQLIRSEPEAFFDYAINKLAKSVRHSPSQGKVEILKAAITCRQALQLKVSTRLVAGEFLLKGWQLTKLDSVG